MNQLSKIKSVALDTNIFIYYFNEDKNLGPKAKLIIDRLSSKQLKAYTNITTLAEILSSPDLSEEAVKETRKLFLSIPNLEIYSVDENIAVESSKIRRNYNFRLLDAIQIATALSAEAKVFITNDEKLKKFKEIEIMLLNELKV